MHIPKTGGTSFSKFLERHVIFDDILKIHFQEEIAKFPLLNNHKLIRGHFWSHKIFFEKVEKFKLITFLRDPYKRYFSQLKHIAELNYLAKGEKLLADNLYSKIILRDKFFPIKNFERFSDDFVLHESKKHLDDFFFVGISEKYNESTYLMSIFLNSRPINLTRELVSNNNLYKYKTQGNDNVIAQNWKISNSIDDAIYQYSLKLFDKKKNIVLSQFNKKKIDLDIYENFLDINYKLCGKDYISKVHPNEEEKVLFKYAYINYLKNFNNNDNKNNQFIISGKSIINGEGWHRREYIHFNSNPTAVRNFIPYYWSGPKKISDLHIPNWIHGNINLEIYIRSINTKIKATDIIIKLNGSTLKSKIEQDESYSGIKLLLKGSAEKSSLPFSILTFEVPDVQLISEIHNNNDDRLVGFAFDKILITKN